jgi:hypothetical protein
MATLVIFAVIVAALVAFDALAFRFGVDSRVDSTDPRRAAYPIGIN